MGLATEKMEFREIVAKVLASIPKGFVFDDIYIAERLSADYSSEYLKFIACYADREKPMEMAIEEIAHKIETFEDVFVKEQNLKVMFPTLHKSISRHKLWKKI